MGVGGSLESRSNVTQAQSGTNGIQMYQPHNQGLQAPATSGPITGESVLPSSPTPSTANRSSFSFPNHTRNPIAQPSGHLNLSYTQSLELTSRRNSVQSSASQRTTQSLPFVPPAHEVFNAAQFVSNYVSDPALALDISAARSASRRNTGEQAKVATDNTGKLQDSVPSRPVDSAGVLAQSSSITELEDVVFGLAPDRIANSQFHSKIVDTDPAGTAFRPKYERMHSGRLSVYIPEEDEVVDSVPYRRPYRYRDMFLTMWAIGTYLFDYVMDWVVAAGFYRDHDYYWFGLTVTFIVVPHLTMMGFSLAWYLQDQRNRPKVKRFTSKQWLIRIVVLLLQLAPVLRYVDSLRYGYRFRNSQHVSRLDLYESLCFENADAAMLRLFEAFMEAAPQLVLQIYIVIFKQIVFDKFGFLETLQIVSILTSWISLATAMATFHRAQRFSQHGKGSMSLLGTIMQFGWHLFIFASRVIAIALFTVRFKFWGPVVCALHVVVMIVWIFSQRTDFCPNRWLEYLYNISMGCLYLFAFINVKDTPTRWKYVFYYGLYYTENVVLITLWFTCTYGEEHWFREPAMAAVIGGFWIGIFCFMIPYYLFLHPDKGMIIRRRKESYAVHDQQSASQQPKWWRNTVDFCL